MDYGHKQADDMLKDVEKRIQKEYQQAAREVEQKLNRYLEQFEKNDSKMLKMLDAGEITRKEYTDWRTKQMMMGEKWKSMRDQLSDVYVNADKAAHKMVNEHKLDVYALNHNYGTYEIEREAKVDTMYSVYDKDTVARLVKDNPKLLPNPGKATSEKIRQGKLKRWNEQKIQSVMTQGVLQGESIPKIAKRLSTTVGAMGAREAISYARTMTTSAENAGRLDSYKRAEELGLKTMKQWLSAHDGRVRRSHREVDGEAVPVDQPFSNDLMYPGDMDGPPEEVYNCRCTLIGGFEGFMQDFAGTFQSKEFGSYEEWKEGHYDPSSPSRTGPVERRNAKKKGMDIEDVGRKPRREGLTSEQFHKERRQYNERRDRWIEQEMPKKSMSLEELGDWCKRNDVVIRTDMSEVDGRMLTAYTQRMDKLFEDFPDVKNYRRYIDFGQYGIPEEFLHYQLGFDRNADYFAEAGFGMTFGPSFADAREALGDKLYMTSINHLTRGDGTINQVFDHEFGHNVMSWMVHKNKMTMQQRLDFEDDIIKSLMGKKGMSEYASVNANEMFAEGFSAWYGGEQTEFAEAMEKFLKKHEVIK